MKSLSRSQSCSTSPHVTACPAFSKQPWFSRLRLNLDPGWLMISVISLDGVHHFNFFGAMNSLMWLAVSVWFWLCQTNLNWLKMGIRLWLIALEGTQKAFDLTWTLVDFCFGLAQTLKHRSFYHVLPSSRAIESFGRVHDFCCNQPGWTSVGSFDLFWLGPLRVPHLFLPWPDLPVCGYLLTHLSFTPIIRCMKTVRFCHGICHG